MASAVPDHFALFGLQPSFDLDNTALDAAFKRLQSRIHPDRFAAASAAEKRVAMQWAARANEAFQVLRLPVKRAAYLCELNGVPPNAESNTAMPAEFLMQQLEWREAAADPDRVDAVAREAHAARETTLVELAQAIDRERDYVRAAALVRQLMFIDKLREEIGAVQQEEAA